MNFKVAPKVRQYSFAKSRAHVALFEAISSGNPEYRDVIAGKPGICEFCGE